MNIKTVDLDQYLSDPPGTLYYWNLRSLDQPSMHVKHTSEIFFSFCTSDLSFISHNKHERNFYFNPHNQYAFKFDLNNINEEILERINLVFLKIEKEFKISIPRIYSFNYNFKKFNLSISILKRNI